MRVSANLVSPVFVVLAWPSTPGELDKDMRLNCASWKDIEQ